MPTQNKALPFLIVVVFIIAVYAHQSQVTQEQGIFSFLKGLFGKKEAKTTPPLNQPIQTQTQPSAQPQQQCPQCQSTDDTLLLVELSIAEQSNRQLYAENVKLKYWATLCNDYIPPKCPVNSYEIEIGCSGSMLPNFYCNFKPHVYIPNDISEIKACDVVVAKNPTPNVRAVFHRVVGINDSSGVRHYVLKGDANIAQDSYQPVFADIERKVCYE